MKRMLKLVEVGFGSGVGCFMPNIARGTMMPIQWAGGVHLVIPAHRPTGLGVRDKSIDAMKSVAIGTTAGIVAPPLFAAVVLAQDLLRPEFDPARRFISELAIGPLGWIQIANFLVLGAAIATFARTVAVECCDKPLNAR